MDDEALADPRVYAALTPQTREYVEKRGNAKQRAALAKAASHESGVTRLTAGEVASFAARPEGRSNLSRFFDSLATKKRKNKDDKDEPDPEARGAAEAAVRQGLLDPSQMRAQQFLEEDGEVAKIIATTDDTPQAQELLVKISQDEKLAAGLSAGAATYRNKYPSITPEEDQKLAEVQFMAGGGAESFKNADQRKAALTGSRSQLIVKAITAKKLREDQELRSQMLQHIGISDISAILTTEKDAKGKITRQPTEEDETNMQAIIETIIEEAKKKGASEAIKTKANEIRNFPALRRLARGWARRPRSIRRPGGIPPT